MQPMKTASQLFGDDARQRLNAAVANAESKTSAEIVPVVATASGRYDRAEDIAGFCFALVALVIAWLLFQHVEADAESWIGARLALNLLAIVLILIGGFIVGAALASRVHWLRRLFTTRAEMEEEVSDRARQVFFDQRIHHAHSSGGVLIYISLFEHMAVVLADEHVIEKLGLPAIESLCAELTSTLRGGDKVAALEQTIAKAAVQLAEVMPRQSADANELPDALVTID